jgi:hypothetical protein
MKFPKHVRKVAEKYQKCAIELYGQRFDFTEFYRFSAKFRKCAILTCNNEKYKRDALCRRHLQIYRKYKRRYKNNPINITDPMEKKLFDEVQAHYDSDKAIKAQNQAEAEKKDAENGKSNECIIKTCNKKRQPSRNFCAAHENAAYNYYNHDSEKNKKFLDEYRAYLHQKEEKKEALRAAGPTCRECGVTGEKNFSPDSRTITGFQRFCNLCRVAKFEICHKHNEPGKTCYKQSCIFCKLNDGKQPSKLCHDNEYCITTITRPSHAIFGLSCQKCFARKNPDNEYSKRHKEKEDIFGEFLKSTYSNIKIERNFCVHVTIPSGEKRHRYLDFYIKTKNFNINIEFDEFQHQFGYDTPCHQMRSDLIFEALESSGKKYVLLRFNPDAFTAKNGDRFRTCFAQKPGAKSSISDKAQWDMRTSYFKSRLDEWMQADPENLDIFNVEYLFYDGFDTSMLQEEAGSSSGGSRSGRKRKRN